MTSLVVGWLVVGCHARALWPNGASYAYSYYGTLIGHPIPGIQWYNFRPPGVIPNRGMGPPWGAFCQITWTSCFNRETVRYSKELRLQWLELFSHISAKRFYHVSMLHAARFGLAGGIMFSFVRCETCDILKTNELNLLQIAQVVHGAKGWSDQLLRSGDLHLHLFRSKNNNSTIK